jgi:hypothetical protein
MAKKAWRELRRCIDANSSDDRRDAAINCAITAWHMTDWAWVAIAANDRHNLEVAALLGVQGHQLTRDDLVKWAISECPELVICQAICNGSKHVVCNDLSAELTAPDRDERGPGRSLVARAEILHDGSRLDAIGVLEKAVYFWARQATNDSAMR